MRISTNEQLILQALKVNKKAMERRILIEKTGISDKNISAKLNSLEVKGLISSEMERKGRTMNRWVQLTKEGKDILIGKIEITKKPKKIPITKAEKPKAKPITKAQIEKAKKPKYDAKEYIEAKKGKIEMKPLPASIEMKKELRLLINLVLTHRKEEYAKYGFKSVSEIRSQIDTLIDQLGR